MNANDRFFARDAKVDSAAVAPLPASRKIYVAGSRPDIRVPMREITQSDTPASFGAEKNPPMAVYDCSGPYTDPRWPSTSARGCRRCAPPGSRSATTPKSLPGHVLVSARRASRIPSLRDCASTCIACRGAPRPALNVTPDALCAQGHRHARDGVRRHPREPAACGARRAISRERDAAASGAELRRGDSRGDHARVRARRSGPRPRDHPRQHQSPGIASR